ncbi:YqhG family protein [Gracilibacillus alcaliphilus]|uniref:YqhG family protein n=1 Tax=Gracilibacillus alcaliphilus TaxID=1401441 RepID=UPI00195B3A11|nr:YqhG family protein [Gracilibacillus alcaliphilus]MBM7675043.1 hypothetical protein [Gracilibacillus alcaliphilus]
MIDNLQEFLYQFFSSKQCQVTKVNQTELSIQLTRELDQALMNRPFYWHYMDKIGRTGEPMSLHLDTGTQPENKEKEWIHYGSPRLQQIFQYLGQTAKFTVLYETTTSEQRKALLPWLLVNVRVQYYGKQTKEQLHSIGLQLINGQLVTQMMDRLATVTWGRRIEDYCYTISPLIKPKSGFQRVFQYVENQLLDQDNQWIQEANTSLEEELQLLRYFFAEREEQLAKEEQQLRERLSPRIQLTVHNAGLFYLTDSTSSNF